MSTLVSRDYSCKDEEVAIIGGFVLSSLRRDLADFTNFSPRFINAYVDAFEGKIIAVKQLTAPEIDTVEHKQLTDQIKTDCESLSLVLNKVQGYLMLSKDITVSDADFGITLTRRSISSKDVESILDSLGILNTNIAKFRQPLQVEGMTDDLIDYILVLTKNIDHSKQMQYQIISNRRIRVQDNVSQINDLYAQINEINTIGKALYKKVDPARERDYNMTELKKRVHNSSKSSGIAAEKKM